MKHETTEEESKPDVKASKPEEADSVPTTSDEYGGGPNPLFVADVKKLGPAKRWKKDAVVNQKFILSLDQTRGPKDGEDLNIGATHAIAVATDNLIEDLKIPEDYWMTLQIGSREHRKEVLTGETWKVPVSDFTKRALYTQSVLAKLSDVLNSGQFITNDIGFSASVLFTRPERKGGKRAGSGPGQKIWDQMAKESRCVCEIKNKDELCCGRAIVTMREYVKRQPVNRTPSKIFVKPGAKIRNRLKRPRGYTKKQVSLKDLVGWKTLPNFKTTLALKATE